MKHSFILCIVLLVGLTFLVSSTEAYRSKKGAKKTTAIEEEQVVAAEEKELKKESKAQPNAVIPSGLVNAFRDDSITWGALIDDRSIPTRVNIAIPNKKSILVDVVGEFAMLCSQRSSAQAGGKKKGKGSVKSGQCRLVKSSGEDATATTLDEDSDALVFEYLYGGKQHLIAQEEDEENDDQQVFATYPLHHAEAEGEEEDEDHDNDVEPSVVGRVRIGLSMEKDLVSVKFLSCKEDSLCPAGGQSFTFSPVSASGASAAETLTKKSSTVYSRWSLAFIVAAIWIVVSVGYSLYMKGGVKVGAKKNN